MNKLVNEELDKMKYLLGYQKGKVISEQAAVTTAPSTVEDVIKQIQTTLNTKYGAKLNVDGKWGNLTQTAFETAIKTKTAQPTNTVQPTTTTNTVQPTTTVEPTTTTNTVQPTTTTNTVQPTTTTNTVQPTTTTNTVQPTTTTNTVQPTSPDEVLNTAVEPQSRRDQRRARQDLRRGNRRAMQDLRTQQRAQ